MGHTAMRFRATGTGDLSVLPGHEEGQHGGDAKDCNTHKAPRGGRRVT